MKYLCPAHYLSHCLQRHFAIIYHQSSIKPAVIHGGLLVIW